MMARARHHARGAPLSLPSAERYATKMRRVIALSLLIQDHIDAASSRCH